METHRESEVEEFIDLRVALPMLHFGSVELPPGEWAALLQDLDFTDIFQGNVHKTETLAFLDDMDAKRELVLHERTRYTPQGWHTSLNLVVRRAEAALGFVVGEVAEEPCDACAGGAHPFGLCVIVEGCPGMKACVSCHFRKSDNSCSHRKPRHKAPTKA